MKKFFFIFLFIILFQAIHAQENQRGKGIWGIGVSQATFKCKDLNIKNNLIGGTIFLEPKLPMGAMAASRFELNYFVRTGDTIPKSNNIKSYFNIKGMIGTVINKGKRIQFPFLFGFSYNSTSGGLSSAGWGLTGKGGLRMFITKKISIFGEAGFDGMLYPDIKLKYSSGKEETLNLYPTNFNLNVGIVFSNF